jgi:dynein heavy chain
LTEIFGMHENAEITSAINSTNALLATALGLQPRAAAAAGKTQEQVLTELAADLFSKMPKLFDSEYAAKRHPICYEDSMNTVLQ